MTYTTNLAVLHFAWVVFCRWALMSEIHGIRILRFHKLFFSLLAGLCYFLFLFIVTSLSVVAEVNGLGLLLVLRRIVHGWIAGIHRGRLIAPGRTLPLVLSVLFCRLGVRHGARQEAYQCNQDPCSHGSMIIQIFNCFLSFKLYPYGP